MQNIDKLIAEEVFGHCACRKLQYVMRKVTRQYDEVFRQINLTSNQFALLAIINANDGVTLTELAEIIGIERTTLLRNLNPLDRDGFISISAERLHRSRTAQLTAPGAELLERALPLWRKSQFIIKERIGSELWESLQDNLTSISKKL